MKLIQDLAREVGAVEGVVLFGRHDNTVFTPGELLTFAALVIEQEHARLLDGIGKPYAWHYTTASDVSVWHSTPSVRLAVDMEAARVYPNAHKVVTLYTADQMIAAVLRERERCVVEVDKVLGKNQITEVIRGMQ